MEPDDDAYERSMAEIRRRSEVMAEPRKGWYTNSTREPEPAAEDPEPPPDEDDVA
jgi:hypothetical protein